MNTAPTAASQEVSTEFLLGTGVGGADGWYERTGKGGGWLPGFKTGGAAKGPGDSLAGRQ